MKKILAITCMLVLALAVSSTAWADADHWRLLVTSDDGAGTNAGMTYVGCWHETATDGYDAGLDNICEFVDSPDKLASWTVSVMGSQVYDTDLKETPSSAKVWDLRVFAGPGATYTNTRLLWSLTGSQMIVPPSTLVHTLRMVDNKGASAPELANGTVWTLSVPTEYTEEPFFTLSLPRLNVTSYGAAEAIAQGYILEYTVKPVPEPSSMLALGAGLSGLVGFALRRRRA